MFHAYPFPSCIKVSDFINQPCLIEVIHKNIIIKHRKKEREQTKKKSLYIQNAAEIGAVQYLEGSHIENFEQLQVSLMTHRDTMNSRISELNMESRDFRES